MDFRVGRIRFPFRHFFRSLLFGVDSAGRRRLKYERRRNRLGMAVGVGFAGLVVGSGLYWQQQQNRSAGSAEMIWQGDDLDAIDRDLNSSMRRDRSSVAKSTAARVAERVVSDAEVEEIAPAPPELLVQTESEIANEGPSLLLTQGIKGAGEETVSHHRAESPHQVPAGARLLGVIEEIPAHEQSERSRPRKNERNGDGPNAGPTIVPGQSTK